MNKITSFSGDNEKETHIEETKAPSPEKPRQYKPIERVVYGPFLERLFWDNEKDKERDTILRCVIFDKYGPTKSIVKNLESSKVTINSLRTKYNRGALYSGQKPLLMLSLVYNDEGKPAYSARERYRELTYSDGYQFCLQYKVADPRFVAPEAIAKILDARNDGNPDWLQWSVPNHKQLAELEEQGFKYRCFPDMDDD